MDVIQDSRGGLSLDPQHTYKKLDVTAPACSPETGLTYQPA